MKLPDFFNSEPLNRVKSLMGIQRDKYATLDVPGRLSKNDKEALGSGAGIAIEIDEVKVLPDGTLAYKDSRILLHIRDITVGGYEPKYHLYDCTTLIDMREKARFQRYVASTTNDGTFIIQRMLNNTLTKEINKLKPCQNCLKELCLDGFDKMNPGEKKLFVSEFLPDRFFALYPRSLFRPNFADDSNTAPTNIYSRDWGSISSDMRSNAGWRCEQCKCDLSSLADRKYLHVHHKNGLRNDNSPANLIVLCISCHAEKPNHGHIYEQSDYCQYGIRVLSKR